MARLKVGVLISGRGSNLQALIEACAAPAFPAEIVCVIANGAATGLDHAARAGIAHEIIAHRGYADRDAFDHALDAALRRSGAELVCLAGFMRLLTPWLVERWRDRMINIHPSLLPAFPGLHTHERALAAGVRLTGCTVHFVRLEMDSGPIIAQAAVPVLTGDTPDRLAARVLAAEHRIYPLALRLIAENRVRVVDERALTAGTTAPSEALLNPLD
jgi:phosphoribosylglycinamide formyltransferase-1